MNWRFADQSPFPSVSFWLIWTTFWRDARYQLEVYRRHHPIPATEPYVVRLWRTDLRPWVLLLVEDGATQTGVLERASMIRENFETVLMEAML